MNAIKNDTATNDAITISDFNAQMHEVRSEILSGQISTADIAVYITLRTVKNVSHNDALQFVKAHSFEELGEHACYVAIKAGMTPDELDEAANKADTRDAVDYAVLLGAYLRRRAYKNHDQSLRETFEG